MAATSVESFDVRDWAIVSRDLKECTAAIKPNLMHKSGAWSLMIDITMAAARLRESFM